MRLKQSSKSYKFGIKLFLAVILSILSETKCEKWEDIAIVCPHECACQYNHMNDLSVTRWIKETASKKVEINPIKPETTNDAIFDYEDGLKDENPLVKAATCFLQHNTNIKDFITSLPQDLQVLKILYGGGKQNITIHTSEIAPLQDLTTLEIRGTTGNDLQLVFDEPLNHLKYTNLEAIQLQGVEHAKRRPNYQTYNPSDHFDYIPESEKEKYNVSLKIVMEEVEIVPYEVYLMEKKRSKTVTFYGWDSLKILRIHGCKLDELYWEIFDGLESLEHLSLEHNQIKVIPAFAFFGVMNIKTLSLARNEILDLHYRALAGLLNLEQLDLSHNLLSKLSELTFPPFLKLEILDLMHNPLKYIFPATFGVMNTTKVMYFGAETAALDLNSEDMFEHLDQLKELTMLNVTAETLNANTLRGLKSLEKLKIRGAINRVEFDAFADKPKLKELVLSDCGIEEISMDTLFGIQNIEIIDLSNNNLKEIPYGLLDEQKQLKEIYLQNNQLQELPHNFFEVLVSLKLARLTENPWLCTCEMISWKQGVTNKVKSTKTVSRACLFDESNSKRLNCGSTKTVIEYVYDNKMAPRCGNPEVIKGRSIYYALRKDLRCSTKKVNRQSKIKSQDEKKRLTSKFEKTYAQRLVSMNNHPLQPKLESSLDFEKHKRQKMMQHKYENKVLNTIRKENKMLLMTSKKNNKNISVHLEVDENAIIF